MADTTRNLGLPLLAAAQAQKHVTHNEALGALDALVQLACLDKDLAAPPAAPADGDRYLVTAASPAGAWTGLSGQVVHFADGVWVGAVPRPGWLAYLLDEADLYVFTGSAWTSFRSSLTVLQNLSRLGVGTAADASNRFALKSDAALLSWDDVTPGSGHLHVTLNKQAPARDAALTFQTGFSTRALFGLLGDDNVAVKVSPDGATFTTAFTANASTGRLTLGRIGGPVEISSNAGALPALPSNTVLRVSGADNAQGRLVFDGFGTGGQGNVVYRYARGTAAAPSAIQSGDILGQFTAFGYGATAYSSTGRGSIAFKTAETWTDAAQGSRIALSTTPLGAATTQREVIGVEANGAVTYAPMSADPTTGLAAGQLYANGTVTALKWFNGTAWARINNFAKAAAYTSFDNYIGADTWTKVQFNNADSNDQGAFVAATSRFVAPEAGLYAFGVALVFKKNGAGAPSAMEIQLYRNGAATGRGRAAATGTLVDGITTVGLSSTLKLAASDAVEVFVRFSGADGYAAAADSLFSGRQLA